MTPPLSGVSISTFGSISVLPIDVRKKAKNTNWPNYNCSLFISLFRKLSKHTTYLSSIVFKNKVLEQHMDPTHIMDLGNLVKSNLQH